MKMVTVLIDSLVLTASLVMVLFVSLIIGGTAQAIWLIPVIILWLFDVIVFINRLE